jgi:MoaA/NifB/PqqE/SkfB family radical SAM enzyme
MVDPGSSPFVSRRTLSVMPTYACNASCKHCGTISNPKDENRLELDVMLAAISEASTLGFDNVVFTGGEPTLDAGPG